LKKCPVCAEIIKDDAVKCKHCGEWLNKPFRQSEDIKGAKSAFLKCDICGRTLPSNRLSKYDSCCDDCRKEKFALSSRIKSSALLWIKAVILTFIVCLTLQYIKFVLQTMDIRPSSPETAVKPGHFIWITMAFIFFAATIYLLRVRISLRGAGLFILFSSGLLAANLYFDYGIVMDNYSGIEYTLSKEETMISKNKVVFASFIYRSGSPEIEKDIREREKFGFDVKKRGFLFWQTGLSAGFSPHPAEITQNKPISASNKLSLSLITASAVLLEMLLKGAANNFIFVFGLQLAYFGLTDTHLWWSAKRGKH